MTQLERKTLQMFEDFGGLKKVITATHINKGTIGIECAIRWKDNGEKCVRDIAMGIEPIEGKPFDDDFFFHTRDISAFLFLLANLDFTRDEFDNEQDWLNEIAKFEGNDKEDYFNSREDFDIIDIIKIWVVDEQPTEPIIGKSEIINGGTKYTAEYSGNGYIFKDYNAIKKKEGICYIAECGFDDGDNDGTLILTPDNTWENINSGAVVTYESALEQVKDWVRGHALGFNTTNYHNLYQEFAEKITDYILQEVDWQCFSTYLNNMDLCEELDFFLQDKFAEFAKARLEKDGDDTEYEDNEDLFDKLANYLGRYCYRNDDYSLTDWDSLIDRWENEPNY